MRKKNKKTKVIGFRVSEEYPHSATDFKDAVNTFFPILWNYLSVELQTEISKRYPEILDKLDLRED